MPLVYGTAAGLKSWMQEDAERANAGILLRVATGLVLDATASAVYATDDDGRAHVGGTRDALTEAVYTQAEAWALAGVDPRPGVAATTPKRAIAAKSIGGASWTYEARSGRETQTAADLASGEVLIGAAVRVLANAGLLTTRIRIAGGQDDGHPLGIVHVGETPYNPVTGSVTPVPTPEVYT